MVRKEINKHFQSLKGISILFVIMQHTLANAMYLSEILFIKILYGTITGFAQAAVPLFIFISGYLSRLNYKNKNSFSTFYKNRIKAIIPPYIFYSIIFQVLIHNNFNLILFVERFITFTTEFHFWFFGIIIPLYLIFPFLNNLLNRLDRKHNLLLLILILIIQYIWIGVMPILWDMSPDFLFYVIKYFPFAYLFYFILGMFIADYYAEFSNYLKNKYFIINNLIIYGFCGYINMLDFFILPTLFIRLLPLSISAIIIFLYFIPKISKRNRDYILSVFGKYSFKIFLIHPIFIIILSSMYFEGIFYYFFLFILVALMSLSSSIILNKCRIYKKIIPKQKRVVSERDKRNYIYIKYFFGDEFNLKGIN